MLKGLFNYFHFSFIYPGVARDADPVGEDAARCPLTEAGKILRRVRRANGTQTMETTTERTKDRGAMVLPPARKGGQFHRGPSEMEVLYFPRFL